MQVIAISGKAQHGKDTTAGILKSQLEADGNKVLIIHYADLLKYICCTFFGWNGKKDSRGRYILQHVGTDIIRKQRPNFWVDFIIQILSLFPDEWSYILIPDCRFPNEIGCLKSAGFETTHIRVVRPGFKSPLSNEQQQHPSETALDNTHPDYYIDNSGTIADLQVLVSEWITKFNGFHQMTIEEYINNRSRVT